MVLHSWRPEARAAALAALARSQGAASVSEARKGARPFNLDEALRIWAPDGELPPESRFSKRAVS